MCPFECSSEGFGAVQERIREAQSEASARSEMQTTSIQGKLYTLEDNQRDMEAEAELSKLEERLGLTTSVGAPAETQNVVVAASSGTPVNTADASAEAAASSEAERQLEELEKRLKGG